jgi:hypothetical protein
VVPGSSIAAPPVGTAPPPVTAGATTPPITVAPAIPADPPATSLPRGSVPRGSVPRGSVPRGSVLRGARGGSACSGSRAAAACSSRSSITSWPGPVKDLDRSIASTLPVNSRASCWPVVASGATAACAPVVGAVIVAGAGAAGSGRASEVSTRVRGRPCGAVRCNHATSPSRR